MNETSLIWFFAGVVLLIIEIFTPTFFISCFGIGSLAAGIISLIFPHHPVLEFVFFIWFTVMTFFLIQPLAESIRKRNLALPNYTDSLVGCRAVVLETIGPGLQAGRIKVNSDSWMALSENGVTIPPNTEVIIISVESAKVVVKPFGD